MSGIDPRANDLLKEAVSRESGKELKISIRDLLDHWGAKRRGYLVVEDIQSDLRKAGLTTVPSFTDGWIDNIVTLVQVKKEGGKRTPRTSPDIAEETDRVLPDVSLTVGSLPSANRGVASVTPQDTLEKAQSIMMRYDYSQLAVLSGVRDLRGAVTWESMAQARIRNPKAELPDTIIFAEIVRSDDDLLVQIPRIIDAGFVFVQASASDRKITGIVTTADLSEQFAVLARPFFVLAEIERRLRRIIDRAFDLDDIKTAVNPSESGRKIRSVDDLTLGEYVRLLENPSHWPRLRWILDRNVFVEALHQVRETRNEVMHFSPDPLDVEQIKNMENFLKWLRKLDS